MRIVDINLRTLFMFAINGATNQCKSSPASFCVLTNPRVKFEFELNLNYFFIEDKHFNEKIQNQTCLFYVLFSILNSYMLPNS